MGKGVPDSEFHIVSVVEKREDYFEYNRGDEEGPEGADPEREVKGNHPVPDFVGEPNTERVKISPGEVGAWMGGVPQVNPAVCIDPVGLHPSPVILDYKLH